MGFADKIFGTHSDRELKRIMPLVNKVEALRPVRMGRHLISFCLKHLQLSGKLQKE